MTQLARLLYVSTARDGVDRDEVERLLEGARRFNSACGVGGCLLFYGGRFLQALEGERAALDQVLARIRADARHDRVRVLYHGPAQERDFAGWSMRLLPEPTHPDRAVTAFLAGLGREPAGADDDDDDARMALTLLKRLSRGAGAP